MSICSERPTIPRAVCSLPAPGEQWVCGACESTGPIGSLHFCILGAHIGFNLPGYRLVAAVSGGKRLIFERED